METAHHCIYQLESRQIRFRIRANMNLADDNMLGSVGPGDKITTSHKIKQRDGLVWFRITAPCEGYVIQTLRPNERHLVNSSAQLRGEIYRHIKYLDPSGSPGMTSVQSSYTSNQQTTKGNDQRYFCHTIVSNLKFPVHARPIDTSSVVGHYGNGTILVTVDDTRTLCRRGKEWVQITFPKTGWACLDLPQEYRYSVSAESRYRNSALYKLQAPLGTSAMSDRERNEFMAKLKVRAEKYESLSSHDCIKLYHQTTPDAARKILAQNKMIRGLDGSVGPGIYFALSPEETHGKAKHKGTILECLVYVGNIQVTASVDHHYTFTQLRQQGFDSVLMTRFGTGHEYVVFNWDQVLSVKLYDPNNAKTATDSKCSESDSDDLVYGLKQLELTDENPAGYIDTFAGLTGWSDSD